MLLFYGKSVGEDRNCHLYSQEVFRMINFDPVGLTMKMANLGNVCKHSLGEACLSKEVNINILPLGQLLEF